MRFLTAIDPTTIRADGKPSFVWVTTDSKEKGVETEKPFPNWGYLASLFALYQREPIVGLQKSRQVFATTGTLGYAFHLGAFQKNQRILLSKANQEEAEELLEDKVRTPYGRMPPWIQDALEINDKPARRIRFKSTMGLESSNSVMLAVAMNAAVRSMRGGAGSLVIIDEAAFQDYLRAMLRAAAPMAARIICLTSADGSEAGGQAFIDYFDCAPDRYKRLQPLKIPTDDLDEANEATIPTKPRMELSDEELARAVEEM